MESKIKKSVFFASRARIAGAHVQTVKGRRRDDRRQLKNQRWSAQDRD